MPCLYSKADGNFSIAAVRRIGSVNTRVRRQGSHANRQDTAEAHMINNSESNKPGAELAAGLIITLVNFLGWVWVQRKSTIVRVHLCERSNRKDAETGLFCCSLFSRHAKVPTCDCCQVGTVKSCILELSKKRVLIFLYWIANPTSHRIFLV